MDDEQFHEVMEVQADRVKPLPGLRASRDGFTRGQVVSAFQSAFDIIGGVSRLALWANANPTEFYKLYSRLMPATSIQNIFESGSKIVIEHAIGRTPLDQHPGDQQDANDS